MPRRPPPSTLGRRSSRTRHYPNRRGGRPCCTPTTRNLSTLHSVATGADLRPGLVGEVSIVVDRAHLASALGSGAVDVFATPAMIALMEHAARACVDHLLPGG